MSGSLIAVARTPWAPRHTALDGRRPEDLLEAVLVGVAARAGVAPDAIARVLVACDTSVGAQDLNIGRRAALQAGWEHTPSLTADGHGVTGLALVSLATALPGLTVVAGVDASSMVPPGAGLVRDYGRPTLDQPEHRWLDSIAAANGLDAAALDRAADEAMAGATLTSPAIVDMGATALAADTTSDPERGDPFDPDGVVAPHHLAPWADGAAAVLVGSGGGRPISASGFDAVPDGEVIGRLLAAAGDHQRLVVDNSAVVAALAGGLPTAVPSPLAIGSAPSCDGLRALADAAVALDDAFEVRTRGGHGQIAAVTVGPRDPSADAR